MGWVMINGRMEPEFEFEMDGRVIRSCVSKEDLLAGRAEDERKAAAAKRNLPVGYKFEVPHICGTCAHQRDMAPDSDCRYMVCCIAMPPQEIERLEALSREDYRSCAQQWSVSAEVERLGRATEEYGGCPRWE